MEWIIEFTQIKPGSKLNLYNTIFGQDTPDTWGFDVYGCVFGIAIEIEMFISKYAQNVGP